MMEKRTIEDRLREEYFQLVPDIRRVAENVETEVRYCLNKSMTIVSAC